MGVRTATSRDRSGAATGLALAAVAAGAVVSPCRSFFAQQSVDAKPVGTRRGPVLHPWHVGAQAFAVGALLVDVHFDRHLGFVQRQVEHDAVLRRYARVFGRVDQKCRRRFGA